MMLQVVLASMEICMMVAAIPLSLMLPGAMFAAWTCCCAAVVVAMCWLLNAKEQMYQCMTTASSEGWMVGQENDDEKWMFLGGMGMSSRHCHRTTLPILSKLFSRPMTCICMPTWGMPLDMLIMTLQRCLPIPTQARRNLYARLRCALLDDAMNRCVVMAHNRSAVIVSQVVSQLCCDLPADKLCKLEIYTFGSAAGEFMMPLGGGSDNSMNHNNNNNNMEQHYPDNHHLMQDNIMSDNQQVRNKSIHVEHFAMADDPFAQLGVLRSIRNNMEGRYCGGVFVLNNSQQPSSPKSQKHTMFSTGMMMEDYLLSLFPAQLLAGGSSLPNPNNNNSPQTQHHKSRLDSTMLIDRDCAEKREIAAMGNYYAAKQGGFSSGGKKRLSWTGLATSAGQKSNGVSAGMVGLEMARRGCKNCDGHKGREVSWLVRYVGVTVPPMMQSSAQTVAGMMANSPSNGGKQRGQI
ncbi:hypothetical protein B0H66DRAFT_519607 [Apodospora peruviana]|uniref:Uncharacterized protein n=1 Tax=Apodospora peruviana TaxID=516989 RepID=A0AAE0I1V6_9PEZI|nr:hypothetical protein B0H66DRAFT_519607 [Apodospora peruviana]